MTAEELFIHAHKGNVWCIIGREPYKTWVTRCDTSFNTFDRKLVCDRVEVNYGHNDVQVWPSDIFLTKEEAETALKERMEHPSAYDISNACYKVHSAISILDFYTDDAVCGVVEKLKQAYVELYEIEKRIRHQE